MIFDLKTCTMFFVGFGIENIFNDLLVRNLNLQSFFLLVFGIKVERPVGNNVFVGFGKNLNLLNFG